MEPLFRQYEDLRIRHEVKLGLTPGVAQLKKPFPGQRGFRTESVQIESVFESQRTNIVDSTRDELEVRLCLRVLIAFIAPDRGNALVQPLA